MCNWLSFAAHQMIKVRTRLQFRHDDASVASSAQTDCRLVDHRFRQRLITNLMQWSFFPVKCRSLRTPQECKRSSIWHFALRACSPPREWDKLVLGELFNVFYRRHLRDVCRQVNLCLITDLAVIHDCGEQLQILEMTVGNARSKCTHRTRKYIHSSSRIYKCVEWQRFAYNNVIVW